MSSRRTRHSLSGGVTVTPRGSSKPPKVFLANGVVTRCLASHPPGPCGSSSPASTVLPRHCDFLPPIPPCFVSFTWRYHGITHFSLPAPLRAATSGLGLVTRYPLPGILPWRRQDLPSSWGTPIPVCTWSPTPAGRYVPDRLRNARVAPAKGTTKAPTRRLSRLNSMAFGLAAYVSRCWLPATAQDWLPGAGQLSRTGFHPQSSDKRFSTHFNVRCPPFPSFLAQSPFHALAWGISRG
jgi:hypothetical protein